VFADPEAASRSLETVAWRERAASAVAAFLLLLPGHGMKNYEKE
jgi:hypothetical protein